MTNDHDTTPPLPPACAANDAALDAWIDGELEPVALARFDAHRASCARCTSACDRAKSVSGWASTLPPALPPPRDLWPDIAARITSPSTLTVEAEPSRLGWRTHLPTLRAIAAMLLVAVGSSVATALVLRAPPTSLGFSWGDPTPGPSAPPSIAHADDPVAAWESQVRTATAELAAALEERRSEIDPEALATVEHNLAIIDQAIAETREALAATPEDARARDAMLAAYTQKIRVLQHALRLPRT